MGSTAKKDTLTDNLIIVNKKMRDYSNDPFVKKKAEQARAFIKKNGLPKDDNKKR